MAIKQFQKYMGYKKFINISMIGGVLLLVIFVFTGIDYIIHLVSPEFSVPSYYFINKIIFGFILAVLLFFLLGNIKNIWIKVFVFSFVISALLQIRYFLSGFPVDFVLLFLLVHFLILVIVSFVRFRLLLKFYC